jgi:hypothetical protein
LPDAVTTEPKAIDALEEAWKAAEVGPDTFEEKVPKEEQEEEEEAKDAQQTSWRSDWAGWESDVEEEKAWEKEVEETTLPEPSSGTGKGEATTAHPCRWTRLSRGPTGSGGSSAAPVED